MDEPQQELVPNENMLDGLDIQLTQASSGKRFVNLLIDRVVFYLLWRFLLVKYTIAIILFLGFSLANRTLFLSGIWLFVVIFDMICMAGIEWMTGGKTIGKFASGTRAVNMDGTRITLKTAVLRNLSRIVPFEAFSGLGMPCYPWHDRWTNTFVIDEELSQLPE